MMIVEGGLFVDGQKGEIKDQTFKNYTTDDNKVDSGKINHHLKNCYNIISKLMMLHRNFYHAYKIMVG